MKWVNLPIRVLSENGMTYENQEMTINLDQICYNTQKRINSVVYVACHMANGDILYTTLEAWLNMPKQFEG